MAKVVIVMEGGYVRNAISDTEDIQVVTVDYDTDSANEEFISKLYGDDAYIVDHEVVLNPGEVEDILKVMRNTEEK